MHDRVLLEGGDVRAQPRHVAGGGVDLLEQCLDGLDVAGQPERRDSPFRLLALGCP
jgi:hypothetical protein